MVCDEGLAHRIRELLEEEPDFAEKKMFGGICFLLSGNMVCGIIGDDLIVRVGAAKYAEMLKLPHAGKFDITGRPMKGWIKVLSGGLDSDDDLNDWLRHLQMPPVTFHR